MYVFFSHHEITNLFKRTHTKKINLLVSNACSLPSHKSRKPYLAYVHVSQLNNHSFEGVLFGPAKVHKEMRASHGWHR